MELLYYSLVVDNNLLVALSATGAQKSAATEATADAIKKILDYVATYPNVGISYCASEIFLSAYSDSGFHNESKGRSRAGSHIILSEN